MKQPHTEQSVQHSETRQNTGNHKKKPGTPEERGADLYGSTRIGKENIEKTSDKPASRCDKRAPSHYRPAMGRETRK